MPFKFQVQPHTGPDSKLCGFYALYHFTDGAVTRQAYIDKATQHYMAPPLGMTQPDALNMVMDGNDPSVFSVFGLTHTDEKTLETKGLGIIANISTGHFFAVRKEGAQWVSYDSYNHTAPKAYPTLAALKAAEFPGNFQIWT